MKNKSIKIKLMKLKKQASRKILGWLAMVIFPCLQFPQLEQLALLTKLSKILKRLLERERLQEIL
jgi:hypothetical protein